jgi:hypothetical protein
MLRRAPTRQPFGRLARYAPVERLVVRTISMTWDPASRLAHITFTAPTEARGEDAQALVDALSKLTGEGGQPFGVLGDGGKLAKMDAGFRATWSRFFKAHRNDVHVAFYNQGPLIRVSADMFRIGTGVDLKSFATEREARVWLRQRGIPA